MRDTNGAGATGFVATNQVVGHHMDRDIFEKHGNDGNFELGLLLAAVICFG